MFNLFVGATNVAVLYLPGLPPWVYAINAALAVLNIGIFFIGICK